MSPVKSALVGATIMAGFGLIGTAHAADDGYQNVFSSVLGAVGLWKTDASPEINYRERAPLVVPPKGNLQKPLPSGSARTAAWPQDPDQLRRKREEEDAQTPSILSFGNHPEIVSKEALMKGRVASSPSTAPSEMSERLSRCGATGNQRGCLVLSPDELEAEHQRYEASGFKESSNKDLVAGKEPDRVYLTQPPKGYLTTTKTVKATTEAPKPRVDEANPAAALVYRQKEEE